MTSTQYSKYNIAGNYFVMSGWYFFFVPVLVPYTKIYDVAKQKGYVADEQAGMLERGAKFGKGWIGVRVVGDVKADDPNIKHLEGEFSAYEFVGPYKEMGKGYSVVMKDYPHPTEMYHVYLTDPAVTPAEQNKTLILFR